MKPDLIILHGALGAASQFDELRKSLSDHFNVHTFDFYGHGQNESACEFSIDWFTLQLMRVIASENLKNPCVFGYSMGGYVALNVARTRPDVFDKIVTLGTKFDWNLDSSKKESGYLNPEKIQEKIPHYAKYLESLHPGIGWKKVLEMTASMMIDLGENPILTNTDLQTIQCDVTLALGSEDNMVSVKETKDIASRIKHANFELLEGVPHPIDRIKTQGLTALLLKEFSHVL